SVVCSSDLAAFIQLRDVDEVRLSLVVVVDSAPERCQPLLTVEQVLRDGSRLLRLGSNEIAGGELLLTCHFKSKRYTHWQVVDDGVEKAGNPPPIPCLEALEARQLNPALLDVLEPHTQSSVLGLARLLQDAHLLAPPLFALRRLEVGSGSS